MTGHTHSLSEWAAFISLGVSFWSSCAAVVWLFADADLADFDPRPAVARAHQVAVYAGHDLNRVLAAVEHQVRPLVAALRTLPRDVGLTLAALLILTIPTGSTR